MISVHSGGLLGINGFPLPLRDIRLTARIRNLVFPAPAVKVKAELG